MTFDPHFKQLLKRQFQTRHIKAETDVKVGTLPLAIDFVFYQEPDKPVTGIWGSFEAYVQYYNIVEFKSAADKCPPPVLHKLRAYMAYFWEFKNLNFSAEDHSAGWLVTARKPNWLANAVHDQEFKKLDQGFYQFVPSWNIFLIVINELSLIPVNYPFLLFSAGQPLEQFITHIYKEASPDYQSLTYLLYQPLVMHMAQTEKIPPLDPDESIRMVIKSFSVQGVIDQVGIENVIKAIGFNEIVKMMTPEELVSYLPPEYKAKLKELL